MVLQERKKIYRAYQEYASSQITQGNNPFVASSILELSRGLLRRCATNSLLPQDKEQSRDPCSSCFEAGPPFSGGYLHARLVQAQHSMFCVDRQSLRLTFDRY